MKLPYLLLTRCLTGGLLLLASCTKNNEQITPTLPTTGQVNVQVLQQQFLAKNYASQLVFPLKNHTSIPLAPQWEHLIQRTASTSATIPDVYVPLESPALTWVGVKDYLLIHQEGGKVEFSEASYLFKAKENPAKDAVNPLDFFAAFTGTLRVRKLTTGIKSYAFYKIGVVQAGPSPTSKGGRTNATLDCYTVVECRWDGNCGFNYDPEHMSHYGAMTSGIDFCDSPSQDAAGCSEIEWQLTESSTQAYCNGNPDPGTGGTGSNGGGDNDSAVSNSTFEYVDTSINLTAAPAPPDVTEYNCNELENRHPDDPTQQGNVGNIDLFVNNYGGQDRNTIIGQRGYQHIAPGIDMSMGPITRYIQDPLNPNIIIDLRHMLTVAYYGPAFGNSVEVIEGLGGHPGSYDHQDYFSNQLGYDFYSNYKSRIDANPSYFAYYLSDYLKDVSLRTHNTDPAAIKQRCP